MNEQFYRGEVSCSLCGKILAMADRVPEDDCHRAALAAQENAFCAGHTQHFNVNVSWVRVSNSQLPLPDGPDSDVETEPAPAVAAKDEGALAHLPKVMEFGERCTEKDRDGDRCALHENHEGMPHDDGTGQWIDRDPKVSPRVHAPIVRCAHMDSANARRCTLLHNHPLLCDFGEDLTGIPEKPSEEPPPSFGAVNGRAPEMHS